MTEPIGLEALESVIKRDFSVLNLPAPDWVPERFAADGSRLLDVLVVGGGMCGVTAAFHLRRLGIHNLRVVDAAEPDMEGPWRTFARMETLRSPKHLTGPASGLSNLAFRSWFEAQHGVRSWEMLGHIPREMWADYMGWFASVTGAGVENGNRLLSLQRDGDGWRAELRNTNTWQGETVRARVVVLATGREGLATPRVSEPFTAFHGAGLWHTGDAPSRDLMRGKDVVVIGLGASAFDYAAEALEAGAQTVKILGRSQTLSRVNKAKSLGYAGFVHGFPRLPDPEKIAIFEYIFSHGIAPPRGTVHRVMRHSNVELVLGAPVTDLQKVEDRFAVTTPNGHLAADMIILGTGYRIKVEASDYLASISDEIRTWREALPDHTSDSEFLDFPYLGSGFDFQPRDSASASSVSGLYCFNHAAMLSLGNLANDIPAVSEGADRLARDIVSKLFLADRERHLANLHAYEEPELLGDEVPGLSDWWPAVE